MTGNGTETMEWEEYSKYMKYQIGKCIKVQKHMLPSMGREKAEHGSIMCSAGKLVESETAGAGMAWPFQVILT